MHLISVDPGLRGLGIAYFYDSELKVATYVKNTDTKRRGPPAWLDMLRAVCNSSMPPAYLLAPITMAVEVPVVYPKIKTDPNDLIDLAGVLGSLVGHFEPSQLLWFKPSDWKGQVPKAVMNARVWARLSDSEQRSVQRVGAKDHNTMDAIGIGLKALNRI